MLIDANPSLSGWLIVGVMLCSGLLLGAVAERLLGLIGVRDRGDGR